MTIKYTVHFKRDRNPGAAAFEALVLHPCTPVSVPGCLLQSTLLRNQGDGRCLQSPPVGWYGGWAPIVSCAVSGFTEQVCFHSFKLFSLASAFRQLHPPSKAGLISLIKSAPVFGMSHEARKGR